MAIKENAPEILILDEPTNNLDIQSMEILTQAIKNFSGTLLLISHDRHFIKDTGITQEIILRG